MPLRRSAGRHGPIVHRDDGRGERRHRRRLGRILVLFPRSRVLTAVFLFFVLDLIEVPALFILGIWFLLQFVSGVGSLGAGVAGGGVAIWAHLAGFAAGALTGFLWRVAERPRREYSGLSGSWLSALGKPPSKWSNALPRA